MESHARVTEARIFASSKHPLKTILEALPLGAVEMSMTKLLAWIHIRYLRLRTKVWIWRFRRRLDRMTEA